MHLEIVVREGQHPGRVFTLAPGEQKTIGRAPECHIRLPDQGVSRRHCTVENLGNRLHVVDLDSANGSYINGQPIQRGDLGPGDQLAVGPTILECRERPAPRRAPGETTLAYREEGTTTVVRKVVDTHFPGMEALTRVADVDNLQRAQRNLATAYQISKLLSGARNLEDIFGEVIESIFETINADRAALLLRDGQDGGGDLTVVAARETTSTAKITYSREEIMVGDQVEMR